MDHVPSAKAIATISDMESANRRLPLFRLIVRPFAFEATLEKLEACRASFASVLRKGAATTWYGFLFASDVPAKARFRNEILPVKCKTDFFRPADSTTTAIENRKKLGRWAAWLRWPANCQECARSMKAFRGYDS